MNSDTRKILNIRRAYGSDAGQLSTLAFRSKAHWGYSIEFMAACKDELTYTPEQIDSSRYQFHVCELDGETVGFYALELENEFIAEIEALFVQPKSIGTGIGRELMAHCKITARALGMQALVIQGDPNAEEFYLAAGGVRTGYRESASIPGRQLPVFRINL